MKESKTITFTPLPHSVPEGTKAGDYFDLVCSFCLMDDGRVSVDAMGDIKAKDEDKQEPKMYRENYDNYTGMLHNAAMPQGGGDSAS